MFVKSFMSSESKSKIINDKSSTLRRLPFICWILFTISFCVTCTKPLKDPTTSDAYESAIFFVRQEVKKAGIKKVAYGDFEESIVFSKGNKAFTVTSFVYYNLQGVANYAEYTLTISYDFSNGETWHLDNFAWL